MNKFIFSSLIILASSFFADPSSTTHLRYAKVGNELGIGYRFHQVHGLDLSLNYAPLFGEQSWTSGKALYVTYPLYHSQKYLYLGAGAGFMHQFENGVRIPEVAAARTYPTGEILAGYEFFADSQEKLFAQVGASIPLVPGEKWQPTAAVGFGF